MDKQILDIINKGEDEAPVLDKVIKDIFMSCDTENEGLVPVSKLVDFIMPFLQGNMHALEELQKSLDPSSIDPSIDIDTFYKDMNEWTLKISSADHIDEEDDILNVTPRDFERLVDKEFSFLQSTPRSSFGHHLLKGYVESGISNLSIVSNANENQSLYFPDRTILEEQIQELQHQKRQVTEELARVKIELTSVNDQNETLQAELEKAYKKVANEQKVITQLQSERKKDDDCEEELCCARKQVVKLERSIANLEKQNVQLQQELDGVLMEKQGLEYQIQRMDRKSEETKSNMVILQTEIDIRKSEVVSEHKTNEALAQHNQELCDIIEKCIITIDRLKLEKAMLNKYYRDKMNKGESLLGVDFARWARSNSFSEYAGISRKPVSRRRVSDVSAKYSPACRPRPFNSPKLLRMLKDPVTPNLDGGNSIKRSASREDVSVGYKNDMNVAAMILNRTNKQEQRSLLDLTPPLDVSRLPTLRPKHLRPVPSSDSVAVDILELILERTMDCINGDGHHFNTPNSVNNVDSPPVMYVVDRTPENGHCDSASPTPYSPKMNDSSDEFFFYNYEMMAGGERQNENLLEEMAKATVCGMDEESECEDSISEGNRDKCDGTPERNPKTYITEVHLKLDEFMDLEHKCEVLEQKIEELENENSTKEMKIFDLNSEIEKLREKISTENKDKIDELLKKIDQLEYEKNILQIEKRHLIDEIRVLNEEKAVLQLSKEELLLKVVEYEREMRRHGDKKTLSLENLSSKLKRETFVVLDRELLQTESPNSKLENRECAKEDVDCLRLDYERVKSSMETYQKLNENLMSKNSLLQKTVSEKEKLMEENLEEIVQIREVSENLKDQVYELSKELDDAKRSCVSLEHELKRKEMDLSKAEDKLVRNARVIEDADRLLKNSDMEKKELNELLERTQEKLRESSEFLDKKQQYEETKRKLEQEVKKQEYLCKKFLSLENELIEEKNSSMRFKEKCDSLQEDILNFRETMTKLEEEMTQMQEENKNFQAENENLKKIYDGKTKEILSLMDAKIFLAKRNEELLQENAEIFLKLDFLTKELDDAHERLRGMDALNRRIKAESEEIFLKLRTFDSEDAESDYVDDYRRESGGLQKCRDRKTSRKSSNFDRLNVRNTKLEEKNHALIEQISDLRDRLDKEVESKNSVLGRMNTIKDILGERRIRLGRATDSTFSVWRDILKKFTNSDVLTEELELESPVLVITGPLDEEMRQLKYQIHVTTVLLSHLTYFMNRQMLKKNEFTQTEAENSIALHRIGEVSTTRMEETFATLVLTYTVDKDLLHQRFHSQKIELGETERSLGEAVSSLTLFLEENARGLDVSHFMENIFQLCTQVSISAVQYGSLRQQTELTAAAEMMVNYVGNLKQEIESLTQQLPAIGPTTTTALIHEIEFQAEEQPAANVNASQGHKRRFISCAKTACFMFTLSMFVLVASLVLNTDAVFKYHKCPPPT